jgi:hypothetical protein
MNVEEFWASLARIHRLRAELDQTLQKRGHLRLRAEFPTLDARTGLYGPCRAATGHSLREDTASIARAENIGRHECQDRQP